MASVPIAYLHKFAGGVALNNICMNQICHLCLSMDGENKLVPLLVRLTPLSLANDRERFPIGVWDSFMIPSSSRMLMFNVLYVRAGSTMLDPEPSNELVSPDEECNVAEITHVSILHIFATIFMVHGFE